METIAVFTKIFRLEETATKAIESVLSQTFSDFRYYILVNNETKELAAQYANIDSRISILESQTPTDNLTSCIHQITPHHSYLFILDGDDYLDFDCLEKLYVYAENQNLDITFCGNTFEINGKINAVRECKTSIALSKHEALVHLPVLYQFLRTMWGKLWKCSLFTNLGDFPDSTHIGSYGGDTLTCFSLLNLATKIGGISGTSYHYRMNASSVSHQLKEGREKSDAYLFNYVLDILKSNKGTLTNDNLIFLFRVYQAAVTDTLRLINTAKITIAKRCDLIIEILNNPITQELFRYEKNNKNLSSEKSALQGFSEIIFYPITHALLGLKECSLYYHVFENLFPEYKHVLSKELFLFISNNTKTFSYLINQQNELLALNLIYQLTSITRDLLEDIVNFISFISSDQLLSFALDDLDFVSTHTSIIISLFCKQYNDTALSCQESLLKTENTNYKAKLLELLLNTSALSENVDLFIFGKLYKMEYCYSIGNLESALEELNDLKDMGISNELTNKYAAILLA